MNELYRDNSIKALNFYSKALSSGGCMHCGNCPINQELMRIRGDGMMPDRHPILRRARHQRLMRGGASIVEVDDFGREIGNVFTSLVPASSGALSTYVNNVSDVADNAPLVTTAIVGSVIALKSLYDSYQQVQRDRNLDPVQKEEVKKEITMEIQKEGDKVIKQVAKQEKAISKPRAARKPRAAPCKPRAAPKKRATRKKCKVIRYKRCY
jgi:hypothetical protein